MTSAPECTPSYGFSTLGCPDSSFQEVVAMAASFDLDFVELRCLNGSVLDLPAVQALFPEPVSPRQILSEADVSVRVLGTSARMFESDLSDAETLAGFALVAERVGAPWLRVFDGGKAGCPPGMEEWSGAERLIAGWNACKAKHGFPPGLLVETHGALTDPKIAAEFCQRFPDVGILWDTHHTWKAGFSLDTFWLENGRHIQHLHVKDSCKDSSLEPGFRYVIPGAGEFPWDDLNRIIEAGGYSGGISLEWEKHWNRDLCPLTDALSAWSKGSPKRLASQ